MKPIKRLPYSSLIILDTEDSPNFSPIYSSQSYQTYYQIFARFDVVKDAAHPEKLKLNAIDFELINFRGPFKLSIKNIEIASIPITGSDSRRVLSIKIAVKVATSRNPKLEYSIDSDDLDQMIAEENQYIDHNDILYVERELLNLYGNRYDEIPDDASGIDQSSYKGIFDIEFFESNGKDSIYKRKEQVQSGDYITVNETTASFTGGPSTLCYNAKSVFVIA